MIKDILIGGDWLYDNLHIEITVSTKHVVENQVVTLTPSIPDRAVWTISDNGCFSVASAWDFLRNKMNHSVCDMKIWHKLLPFKMSFLTLRAVHDRLLTDERYQDSVVVL